MRRPMIILRDIGLRRASKVLLEGASATIQPGQRVALVGANGCGKSSLFALLSGELDVDAGDLEGLGGLRLAHMAQETVASDHPASEYVWRGDQHLAALRDKLAALEDQAQYDRAAAVHSELEDISTFMLDPSS